MTKKNIFTLFIFLFLISSRSIFTGLGPQQIGRFEKSVRDELKKAVPNFDNALNMINQLKAARRTTLATQLELELCKKKQQLSELNATKQITNLVQEKNTLIQQLEQTKSTSTQAQTARKSLAQESQAKELQAKQTIAQLNQNLQAQAQELQKVQQQYQADLQKQTKQALEAVQKTTTQLVDKNLQAQAQELQKAQQQYQADLQKQNKEHAQQIEALQKENQVLKEQQNTQQQLQEKVQTLEAEKNELSKQVEEYQKLVPFKGEEVADVAEQAIIDIEEKRKKECELALEENKQLKELLLQKTSSASSLNLNFLQMKTEIISLHEALKRLYDQVLDAAKSDRKQAAELKVRFDDRGGNIMRYYEMIDAIKTSFNQAVDSLNELVKPVE